LTSSNAKKAIAVSTNHSQKDHADDSSNSFIIITVVINIDSDSLSEMITVIFYCIRNVRRFDKTRQGSGFFRGSGGAGQHLDIEKPSCLLQAARVPAAGLSASTPRFLRWNTHVTVTPPSLEATQAVCHDLLTEHSRTHMQTGVSCSLASTIFRSLTADSSAGHSRFTLRDIDPGSATPNSSWRDNFAGLPSSQQGVLACVARHSGTADSKDTVTPTDRQQTVAQMGYTLMWGLHAWADVSPEVLLFRECLQGRLGQIFWSRSRQLLQALNDAFLALGESPLNICVFLCTTCLSADTTTAIICK
jgi:hypothetical protein